MKKIIKPNSTLETAPKYYKKVGLDNIVNTYQGKLVTIVVPMYNAESYIEICLRSLIEQTYKNIEIIVVDDGSTDNSRNICKDFANLDLRIKILHQNNHGVSYARNVGIAHSLGEFITFADADDWLESDAIETMVRLLVINNTDCVRMSHYVNNNKVAYSYRPRIYLKEEMHSLIKLFISDKIPCYTVLLMIKKNLIIDKIKFNENISFLEDKLFYITLLQSIDTIYLSDIAKYHYCINSDSATKSSHNYTKNIRFATDAHKLISQKIELNNHNLLTALNISQAHIITGYMYLIYKFNGINQIDEEIKSLSENPEFKIIAEGIKRRNVLSNLKYHYTQFICASIMKKKLTIIVKLFSIRLSIEKTINRLRLYAN